MKILYEATLLLCCAIVIFLSTVSGVLILLLWRHELFFGVNTRLVVFLCAMIVVVFSVGFVGTIAESSRALVLYAALLALFPLSILLVEIILRLWASPGPAATVVLKTVPPIAGLNNSQSPFVITTATPTSKQSASPPPTLTYSPSFAANSQPTTQSTSPWNNSWIALPSDPFTTELPLSTQFYQLFREYKAPSPTSGPRTTHLKASEAARNLWRELFSTAAGDKGGDGAGTIVSAGPGTSSLVPGSSIESVLLVALAFVLVQIAIAHLLAAEIRRLRALENQSNNSEEEDDDDKDCAYNEENELFQLEHDSIMMEQFHPSAAEIVELVDPSAGNATTAATLKGTTTMECCLVTFQPEVHYVSTAEAEAASSAIDSDTALLSSLQQQQQHHHHQLHRQQQQHEHHHPTTDIKQPRVHFHTSPQYFGDTTGDCLNDTAAPSTTTSTVTPTSSDTGTAQIIISTMNAPSTLTMGAIVTTAPMSENNNFSEPEMILTPRRGCT